MNFFESIWNMLVSMILSPFQDPSNGWNWVNLLAAGLVIAIVLFIVLWSTFSLLNSAFLPKYEEEGRVFKKELIPAHTGTTVRPIIGGSGGVVVVPEYVSESYRIGVSVSNHKAWMECGDKEFFEKIQVNDRVMTTFSIRRITRSVNITSLQE